MCGGKALQCSTESYSLRQNLQRMGSALGVVLGDPKVDLAFFSLLATLLKNHQLCAAS